MVEAVGNVGRGIIINPNEEGARVYLKLVCMFSYPPLFVIIRRYIYMDNLEILLVMLVPNICLLTFLPYYMVYWTLPDYFSVFFCWVYNLKGL